MNRIPPSFDNLLVIKMNTQIQEIFYTFIDNFGKTAAEIAAMVVSVPEKSIISLEDCRGQGYDNTSNISGRYNGVQSHLKNKIPLCLYSPCGCHSLNLCGANAAESCIPAITFFGTFHTVYNFFALSVKRWNVLQKHIIVSIHRLSDTRWTARIKCI